MISFLESKNRYRRPMALVVGATIAVASLTACGSDSPSTATRTTGVAPTTPLSTQVDGVSVGRPQQLTGTDNGGYAATVTVNRVWRSSSNEINADVDVDVTRGTIPASNQWVLTARNQRTHIGTVSGGPITQDFTGTVSFLTPTDTDVRSIHFGDATSVHPKLAMWAIPALAYFAPPHFKKRKTTTTTRTATKTRTKTTRTKRTTTRR